MAQDDRNTESRDKNKGPNLSNGGSRFPQWIYLVLLVTLVVYFVWAWGGRADNSIDYKTFLDYVEKGYVSEVEVVNDTRLNGTYTKEAVNSGAVELPEEESSPLGTTSEKEARSFTSTKPSDHELTKFLINYNESVESEDKMVKFDARQEDNWLGSVLTWTLPLIFLVVLWLFVLRRMNPGSQVLNIGKSKAKLFDAEDEHEVNFEDVAGLEEAKGEVVEIVEFLKDPDRFTRLGGELPKGVLLVGQPGTGKTLMAKAVAGEAGVPFFSLSGSDFVEMFVGVGASRVRDLFKTAKEKAPCIIFIDEIDAIGRSRGRNSMIGGNDERENTLNQLLSEMDGFDSDKGVIIMAATNRPDVLDSALLRPGRFDRQIMIDKPDRRERKMIFEVHTQDILVADDVNLEVLAGRTPGFAGAEIANVCNEAALLAARKNKEAIEMEDFEQSIDRVIGGLEKKNKLISPEERKTIAYHEAGHAIVGWFLKYTDPVVKVSIVPRGMAALGYAQYMPEERYLYSKEALMDQMTMAVGGRMAEEIVFDQVTTGAQNDLERITKMAYAMVVDYGMSEKVGNVSFNLSQDEEKPMFDKPYSDDTARTIDKEVKGIIDEVRRRAHKLLTEKRNKLDELAETLLEEEVIGPKELVEILGQPPHGDYISTNGSANGAANGSANGAANGSQGDGSESGRAAPQGIDAEGTPAQTPPGHEASDNGTPPGNGRSKGEAEGDATGRNG